MTEKNKSKGGIRQVFKVFGIAVGALFGLIVLLTIIGSVVDPSEVSDQYSPEPSISDEEWRAMEDGTYEPGGPEPDPTPAPYTPSKFAATLAEYMQIQEGMSYSQVRDIIGADGTEISRNSLAGITTVMYSWTNDDFSNMNTMFQNGKLVSKAQFGLQ